MHRARHLNPEYQVTDDELVSLVGGSQVVAPERAWPQRWYILVIFFLLAVVQAATWNFYSPINTSITQIYGWNEATLSWLANTANIAVLIGLPIMSVLIDSLGLRPAVLIATVAATLCASFRCLELIPFLGINKEQTLILAYVAMVCNGLSGTLMNFVGPIISSAWFPTHQRTLSTAVLAVAAPTGVTIGYILGPLVVPAQGFSDELRLSRLHILYWIEAAVSLVVTIAIIAYFPSRPPTAPSRTAQETVDQQNVAEGYKKLFTTKQSFRLWILALCYSIPSGVFGGWGAVLYPNLKNFNFSETEAGWLGAGMTMAGCGAAVLVGFIADRFKGKMKTFIVITYILAGLSFLWFAVFVFGLIPSNKMALYITAIAAGVFLLAPVPLFFELAMETVHGVIPIGAANCLLSLLSTFVQIVFLGVSFMPGVDPQETSWMTWLMVASLPVCLLFFAPWKALYTRLERDSFQSLEPAFFDRWGLY